VEVLRFRSWAVPWQTIRSDYELCVIERGGADWRVGRRRFSSTAGAVHVLPPATFHCAADAVAPADFTVVLLSPERLAPFAEARRSFGTGSFKVDAAPLARSVLALARAVAASEPPLLAESALAEVLETLRSTTGTVGPTPSRAPHAVRRMRELLHEAYPTPLSLEELAREAGVGRHQAVRLFRQEVGTTPFAYLVRLRLSHAVDLLREGASVTTAAHAAGFADQPHLARWFKRVYGVPPGAYLRGGHRGKRGRRV